MAENQDLVQQISGQRTSLESQLQSKQAELKQVTQDYNEVQIKAASTKVELEKKIQTLQMKFETLSQLHDSTPDFASERSST